MGRCSLVPSLIAYRAEHLFPSKRTDLAGKGQMLTASVVVRLDLG